MKSANIDSGQSAKENTINGLSEASAQAWIASDGAGNFNVIALDVLGGTDGKPILEVKKVDSGAAIVADTPSLKLDFGDLAALVAGKTALETDHKPDQIKFIAVLCCDPSTGEQFYRAMPCGGAYN
jgi:hypothetical protein